MGSVRGGLILRGELLCSQVDSHPPFLSKVLVTTEMPRNLGGVEKCVDHSQLREEEGGREDGERGQEKGERDGESGEAVWQVNKDSANHV